MDFIQSIPCEESGMFIKNILDIFMDENVFIKNDKRYPSQSLE